MTDEQAKIRTVFLDAIAIESDDDRLAYVEDRCGDDARMRQEVDALIAAHRNAGEFLAADHQDSDQPRTTLEIGSSLQQHAGTQIGPYTLLQKIGEGGMGVVYMADQIEPVKRRVAIKLIKTEMGSPRVIARFEAERQALAMMSHPNIATILDAGTTDTGIPYFVMELVKGVPITQYCDQHQLSIRERMSLLIPVADAVQHAHQKGIIHRDLKPSNILIAEYDDKPVPKVIDFGVAKALHQDLTDKKVFTSFEQVIGTIEYMSPEQATFNQLDVDTRSDIYSLGVVLYELLTGMTPFCDARAPSKALDERLRTIRESDPKVPSARLSSSGCLPALAAKRKVDPRQLTAQVRGELDWIAMRALEKDRARRYESANALRRDLQRYMSHEAVHACPPSLLYRGRKLVRRHRTVAAAAAIVVTAMSFATIIAVTAYARAYEANQRLQTEIRRVNEQTKIARQHKSNAENAVWDFFVIVSDSPDLQNQPGTQRLRRKLIETAHDYFTNVLQDSETFNLYNQGLTWDRLGRMEDDLGNLDKALPAYKKSLACWRELHDQEPDNPEYANNVGSATILVARTHSYQGDHETALALATPLLPQLEALVKKNPAFLEHQKCLAWLHNLLGLISIRLDRMESSLQHHLRSIEIAEAVLEKDADDPMVISRLAGDCHNASVAFFKQRRSNEALDYSTRAYDVTQQLMEIQPGESTLDLLAAVQTQRGMILAHLGNLNEALEFHRKSLAHLKELVEINPLLPEYREGLGKVHNSIGVVLDAQGLEEEALNEYSSAVAVRERLLAEFPDNPEYSRELIKNYGNVVSQLIGKGQTKRSLEIAEQAVQLADRLRRNASSNPEHVMLVGASRISLSDALAAVGRLEEAQQQAEQAQTTMADLVEREPDVELYRIEHARSLRDLAGIQRRRDDHETSAANLLKAAAILGRYREAENLDWVAVNDLAMCYSNLAEMAASSREVGKAVEHYDQAIEVARLLYENPGCGVPSRTLLIGVLCNQGLLFRGRGETDRELANLEEAVRLGEKLLESGDSVPLLTRFLNTSRINLAKTYSNVGRRQDSIDVYDQVRRLATEGQPALRILAGRHLGYLYASSRQLAAAETAFEETAHFARQFVEDSSDPQVLAEMVYAYHQYGEFLAKQRRVQEANRVYERGVQAGERLLEQSSAPDHLVAIADLHESASGSAVPTEANQRRREAIGLYEKIAATRELDPNALRRFSALYSTLASSLPSVSSESLELIEKGLAIETALAEKKPDVLDYRRNLLKSLINRAIHLEALGRIEEAIDGYRHALAVNGTKQGSSEDQLANWRIPARINMGLLLEKTGKSDEAAEQFRKAMEIGIIRVNGGDSSIRLHIETSFARINVARVLRESGEFEQAIELLRIAHERLARAMRENTSADYARGFLSQGLKLERKCFTELIEREQETASLRDLLASLGESITWAEKELSRWPPRHSNYQLLGNQVVFLRNARAWQLATDPRDEIRDGTQAVIDGTRACELTGHQSWMCLDTLAAAHAAIGEFDRAVTLQEQANELAPEKDSEEMQARLTQYQDDQPFYQGDDVASRTNREDGESEGEASNAADRESGGGVEVP